MVACPSLCRVFVPGGLWFGKSTPPFPTYTPSEATSNRDGISPLALTRCRPELIERYLDVWENEKAFELVDVTTAAWRSSALNAPPEDRSIQLLRVQNSAIEALTRLDRHQEAEVWFGRAKTLQSRANSSPEENARFTRNVVRLMQWRTPNRKAQPRTYLTEIARGDLSGDPKGRRIRNTAREMLARIAIKDGSYFEAHHGVGGRMVRGSGRHDCRDRLRSHLPARQEFAEAHDLTGIHRRHGHHVRLPHSRQPWTATRHARRVRTRAGDREEARLPQHLRRAITRPPRRTVIRGPHQQGRDREVTGAREHNAQLRLRAYRDGQALQNTSTASLGARSTLTDSPCEARLWFYPSFA